MDLIGIENEAEFFPAGTLSDVLKEELRDITARWSGLDPADHPVERLTRSGATLAEAMRQLRNAAGRDRQLELAMEVRSGVVAALGYSWKRDTAVTALNDNPLIPVVSRVADASGRDVLWILEAPVGDVTDEAADPLGAQFAPDQFPEDAGDSALTDTSIEELLADGIFSLPKGPRHVVILGQSQLVLIDERKWPARSVLRFDLQEIFTRADKDTLTIMACLVSREARVPEQGVPLSDRLEEEAQRNANAVTSSLKRTVRDAIEILGQEVLDASGGKYPSNFPDANRRGVWIDGPELSRECLRYMYRLLFLFYAESNPRLKLLDLRNALYATGYSLESLRELESVPLRTTADREGSFLWDSLQRTLGLMYAGLDIIDEQKGSGMRFPAVKVSLLDPQSTPLLNSLNLRNEAIQKVIRLMSLRSTGKSTGRISYAKLGIGQLGAVYETLISFTGVVAKTDLIELKPRTRRSIPGEDEEYSDAEIDDEAGFEDTSDAEEAEDGAGSDPADDADFRRDRVDPLAPSWFVPRSRIDEFAAEDVVFNGTEALIYPKGSFIYRLAGRDREKSASYYTPEPLARLLVKHALMERCKDLSADELLELKILEPAMGSAAFLVETVNQLADLYLERKQKEVGKTIPQDQVVLEKQKVRAFIADRNCFGVDLNPIATELAAISLWLNSLHDSEFSPWFGHQLYAGNSLIGARRASYSPGLLSAKKQADLWLKAKPEEIGWRNRLPEGHVWQWLLPAKDMANFDKDKSIAPFAREAQEHIKQWRKGGFFKRLEPHEVKLLQKLSRITEALFDQVADDLARSRAATADEITLWPDKVMQGNREMDFHAKAKLSDRLTGADHASNTLPYKRLKTALDAWCALWLWPLDKAHELPSRAEFLQGMAMILEGGFTADGSLAAPSVDEFQDPVQDLFARTKDGVPSQNSLSLGQQQSTLFRETNVEALIESFDWLKTAVEVAERERFVHFELIFADVMRERGGFDIIVGNPPWVRPGWNEGDAIAEIDPKYKGLSAAEAKNVLTDALKSRADIEKFIMTYTSSKGAITVASSASFFPFAGDGRNNLYKCFIDLSFRTVSESGICGLIHQDGHLTEGVAALFRGYWYKRIIKRFHFRNEIKSKMFSEVHNELSYSINIYRGFDADPFFMNISHAFLPSQVEECFAHDGCGEVIGLKTGNGRWNTSGHKDRLVMVSSDELRAMADVSGCSGRFIQTRFIQPFARGELTALRKFSKAGFSQIAAEDMQLSGMWDEAAAQKQGILRKQTAFRTIEEGVIYSGSSIYVANPLYKTPRRGCKSNKDFEYLDLVEAPDFYLPRSNFVPGQDSLEYRNRQPASSFRYGEKHSDHTRVAVRAMVALNGERSLISCILPPKVGHISGIGSIACRKDIDTLHIATAYHSIPFDFLIKATGQSNFRQSTMESLPRIKLCDTALHRALRLNCVTAFHAELWSAFSADLTPLPWSSPDPRLTLDGGAEGPKHWNRSVGLRTEFARRMALVEIDVLVAQALDLTLDQLIEIYRIYFPVLQENEAGTWYDQNGRIIWTCSKGLPGVGWLNEKGKSPGRAAWEKILEENPAELTCTAIDDTLPGGHREVTRHFVGPFTRCDRIEDYRRAWAHFERLKATEAA